MTLAQKTDSHLRDRRRGLGSDLARSKANLVRIDRATTTRALSMAAATAAPISAAASGVVVDVLTTIGVVVGLATWLTVTIVWVVRSLGEHRLGWVGNGARNIFGRIIDVELLVDVLGDRLNLSSQLLLDLVQVETVFPVDQVNSETKVTETTRTTNTVQIGLRILGEIKVDDDVDRLNIDTSGQQIRANEVAAHAIAEVVEHAVTVLLKHASVRVEARVAQLSDLFREQLHTVCRIAENDGLVDLELREESVKAVNLLLFFDKSIELCDTTQSEFVHQVDLVGVAHVLVLEVFDNHGECSTEEHDLTVLGMERHQLFDDRSELGG